MIVYAFSFLFPFLLAMLGFQLLFQRLAGRMTRESRSLCAAVLGMILVVTPLNGLPLARWLSTANANFSIPLTAILLSEVWERSFNDRLMGGKARHTPWVFGLVGAALLYPMGLGLGSFDPYGLGYGSPWLLLPMLGVTLAFLLAGNRFGIVLVASILAYNLRLLESNNLWDYLMDPVFGVLSGIVVACRPLGRILSQGRKERLL